MIMITRELKLKPTTKQKNTLNTWLFQLTGVYNWAIRKIELNANDKGCTYGLSEKIYMQAML